MEHNNRKHNLMKLKQLLFTLLALLVNITPLAAWNNGININGIHYYLEEAEAEAFVTYQECDLVWIPDVDLMDGVYEEQYYSNYSGDVVIPEYVTYGGMTYRVAGISDHAFDSCSNLTSVTIPKSVTYIGDEVFNHCYLTSINVDGANPIYDSRNNCNAIIETRTNSLIYGCQRTYIPYGVTSIAAHALRNYDLTNFTIPESVTSIGEDAFYVSSNLGELVYAGKVAYKYVGTMYSWNSNVTLAEGTVAIADGAFKGCTNMTSITIPYGVKRIGANAFSGCSKLYTIDIPSSVTSIGANAFEGTSWYDYKAYGSVYAGNVFYTFKARDRYHDWDGSFKSGTIAIADESLSVAWGDITIPNSVKSIGKRAFKPNVSNSYLRLKSISFGSGVTSISEGAFMWCQGLTTVSIPNNVTYIGKYAFTDCEGLTSVNIFGATYIDSNAFRYCPNLTLVVIPSSVTFISDHAFSKCERLTDFYCNAETVPYTICNAFNFSNIESATLHVPASSVGDYRTTLPWSDFGAIVPIEDGSPVINFADTNTKTICVDYWDSNHDGELSQAEAAAVTGLGTVFYGKQSIKSFDELQYFTGLKSIGNNSVTSIGDNAFYGCSGLTSVTIPSSVTSIGSYAFDGCSSLTSITIPNSVTSIGKGAFQYCSSLTSIKVETGNPTYDSRDNCNAIIETATNMLIAGCMNTTIPNSVTSIGNYAFYNCSSLTSITIPNSVTSIDKYAFFGCRGLTSVTIGNGVTSIRGGAFYGCTSLTSVTIPNSVTNIGEEAFRNCTSLTSITIPNSVTSIDYYAFENCSSLTSITIPESVTRIEQSAFSDCNSLKTITIGSGITYIYRHAFSGSNSLESVLINVKVPLNIDEYCFSTYDKDSYSYGKTNATLYVPAGSKAAYEAASYWQDFKEIVEFIDGDVNSDNEVDVVDVVDIVRYTVGSPAETFVPILADINYNGEVNVGDAVALVNEIAGDQNFVKPWRAPQQNTAADDVLTLTSTDNGMSLCMENERNYTAFQFDLYLPAGTDATDMLLNAQRKQGHQLIYNKVEEGHYRVAAISTSNHTFSGYEGELLAVGLEGIASEDICLRDIRFFTTDGEEHRFDDIVMQSGTTTDIASPQQPSNEEAQDIYDLQGRKMVNGKWLNGKSSKGIYIVNGKKIAF